MSYGLIGARLAQLPFFQKLFPYIWPLAVLIFIWILYSDFKEGKFKIKYIKNRIKEIWQYNWNSRRYYTLFILISLSILFVLFVVSLLTQ